MDYVNTERMGVTVISSRERGETPDENTVAQRERENVSKPLDESGGERERESY